ncbi:hypothetical protein [Actinacidiphila soli]|uniref:hypothetical protein n=1 Tax=Actinacidiphila soli TaxID=2487275 RepID=UPI000FCCCC1B|nr:hypothetical protein [Actinacidiphila soli]
MRIHRFMRMDRATVEKLLDGRPLGPDAGHDALVDLLATLAAPPADGEQAGESAAMDAFRKTRLNPVQHSRSRPMTTAAQARRRSVKALVAALAVTAVSGVAVAAGTGHLPGVKGGNSAVASPTPGRTTGAPNAGGATATADADPATTALCEAYAASTGADRAKKLAGPAFSGLVRVAGGKGKVAAYCAAVLHGKHHAAKDTKTPGHAGSSAKTSKAAKPTHGPATAHPSHSPKATKTSGAAAKQASAAATGHPSGTG